MYGVNPHPQPSHSTRSSRSFCTLSDEKRVLFYQLLPRLKTFYHHFNKMVQLPSGKNDKMGNRMHFKVRSKVGVDLDPISSQQSTTAISRNVVRFPLPIYASAEPLILSKIELRSHSVESHVYTYVRTKTGQVDTRPGIG